MGKRKLQMTVGSFLPAHCLALIVEVAICIESEGQCETQWAELTREHVCVWPQQMTGAFPEKGPLS